MDKGIVCSSLLVPSKGHTFIPSAPIRFASDYTPANDYDAATKIYVDLNGGGGGTYQPQQHLLYLSAAGPKTGYVADGLTLNKAFDNLADAVAAAITHTPTFTNRYVIYCEDAGIFPLSDNLSVPAYVSIYAPNINIASSVSARTLTLSNLSNVTVAVLGNTSLNVNIALDSITDGNTEQATIIKCNTIYGNISYSNLSLTIACAACIYASIAIYGSIDFTGNSGSLKVATKIWDGHFDFMPVENANILINADYIELHVASSVGVGANAIIKCSEMVGTDFITVTGSLILQIASAMLNSSSTWLTESTSPVSYPQPLPFYNPTGIIFVDSSNAINTVTVKVFAQRIGATVNIEIPNFEILFDATPGYLTQSVTTPFPSPMRVAVTNQLLPCLDYNVGTTAYTPTWALATMDTATGLLTIKAAGGVDFLAGHRQYLGPIVIVGLLPNP